MYFSLKILLINAPHSFIYLTDEATTALKSGDHALAQKLTTLLSKNFKNEKLKKYPAIKKK
ncbi:hypothetical protein PHSC3_001625 [Chlamydiales bacterium STE3]|nr:hypothetical protein PHSC3_001625 [Chlamydiales bacterium STE3]